jgi:hypothetical protein
MRPAHKLLQYESSENVGTVRPRLRDVRIWFGVGAVVVGVAGLVWVSTSAARDPSRLMPSPAGTPAGGVRLVSYHGCSDMLAGLRQHAARNVGVWGVTPPALAAAAAGGAGGMYAAAVPAPAPPHSTTNDYVPGVDEPDLVKSAGSRVLTVERGVLRIIDTATKTVTARLTLADPQRAWGASNLLVEGNRALVILSGGGVGAPDRAAGPRPYPAPIGGTSYVLVDLSGSPKVLGTLTPSGDYVDARLVGSTVRLVVRSQPNLAVPQPGGASDDTQQLAQASAAVRRAPISAWLPQYRLRNADGAVSSRTVACGSVSHPDDYTGTSLLTIYSIDLAAGLHSISPVSLAADGDTVYATTSSLYIASNPQWWYRPSRPAMVVPNGGSPRLAPPMPPQQTQIHRFDISRPGAPRYVASGEVAGRLLNQYSLSEYDGYLRVATTTGDALAEEPGDSNAVSTSSSSVYVLRAATLTKVGELDGLGRRQRIYAVRFIGPLAYVVTFQQMDPLYTLDLRDPAAPRIAGTLELTGYSAYLHPASDRTLIGIGQEATAQGRPLGVQISLFDVSNPGRPRRLAHLVKTNFQSGAESDPHAFLYWPQTGTAVLPVNSWTKGQFNAGALVLNVTDNQIIERGTVTQPTPPSDAGQAGITRSLIIGPDLWTVSDGGLMVNDLATLSSHSWIPNQ